MQLKIGLAELQPGWEILLQQEGLSYEEINLNSNVGIDEYSVLIINKTITHLQKEHLKTFLENGGAAIISSQNYTEISEQRSRTKKVKYLIPAADTIFTDLGLIDFHTRIEWRKNKEINFLDRNLKIQFQKIGKSLLLFLPFDLNKLILNSESVRRKFPVDRKELPSEIVAKVSKGKIREIIHRCLLFLHEKRKIPLVQNWRFPNDWKNLFMFRVDTDYCTSEQAKTLYELCKKHKIRGTWFVDTVTRETLLQVYAKMPDQEIALHCRRHLVFPDYETNKENIENGLSDLHEAGISVAGFAAPFGDWNENLARVMTEKGFQYSSEFTLDYDDLPFYPIVNNKATSVLQIPIHPMSTGRMHRSHYSQEEMWQYYKTHIDECLLNGNPIFLYHHPSHGNLEIFDKIFRYVNIKQINSLTYREYADWWGKRNKLNPEIKYSDNELNFEGDEFSDDIFVKISGGDNYALNRMQKKMILSNLPWQKTEKLTPKTDLERTRKWHWRDALYNYESKKGKRNK